MSDEAGKIENPAGVNTEENNLKENCNTTECSEQSKMAELQPPADITGGPEANKSLNEDTEANENNRGTEKSLEKTDNLSDGRVASTAYEHNVEASTPTSEETSSSAPSETPPASSEEGQAAASDEATSTTTSEAPPATSDEATSTTTGEAPAASDEATSTTTSEAPPAASDEATSTNTNEAPPAASDEATSTTTSEAPASSEEEHASITAEATPAESEETPSTALVDSPSEDAALVVSDEAPTDTSGEAPSETVSESTEPEVQEDAAPSTTANENAKAVKTAPPKVLPKPKFEPPEIKVDLFVKAHAMYPDKLGDCPFCHRIMMILKLKKIGGTVCPVNLNVKSREFEDYCAKNGLPTKVPIVQHGETILGDSNAIADYLDKIRPKPKLVCLSKATNAAGDKVFLKFSAFIKNRIKSNDEKLAQALTDELGRLDAFLATSPGCFLDGDDLLHPDCVLLPKLHHVRVAAKHYKDYDIPESLSYVHAYLLAADSHPVFASTKPANDAIVEGWRKHVS